MSSQENQTPLKKKNQLNMHSRKIKLFSVKQSKIFYFLTKYEQPILKNNDLFDHAKLYSMIVFVT